MCEKFLKGEYTPSTTLQTEFDQINIMTYTYESSNKDHASWKKEVALYLLGSISDDIVKFWMKWGPERFSMDIFNVILEQST